MKGLVLSSAAAWASACSGWGWLPGTHLLNTEVTVSTRAPPSRSATNTNSTTQGVMTAVRTVVKVVKKMDCQIELRRHRAGAPRRRHAAAGAERLVSCTESDGQLCRCCRGMVQRKHAQKVCSMTR